MCWFQSLLSPQGVIKSHLTIPSEIYTQLMVKYSKDTVIEHVPKKMWLSALFTLAAGTRRLFLLGQSQ